MNVAPRPPCSILFRKLQWRQFCSGAARCSGHNRWSKIKHDKSKEDATKGKLRTVASQDVAAASRAGDPNPNLNTQLFHAINNAKKAGLSKASIESAIARGQGKSTSGAALEAVVIETMLPHNVGAIIECLTDNKARLLQDIRLIIGKNGGNLAPTSFLFQRKGRSVFRKSEAVGVDDVLDKAVDAGATDVEVDDEGRITVDTEPNAVAAVVQELTKEFPLVSESSFILYDPIEDTSVKLEPRQAEDIENLLQLVEEDPTVQDIYTNVAIKS
ncbi:MAG: hypothetical protein Q9160_007642 [Pyrenula sp. 1 TL-2023]